MTFHIHRIITTSYNELYICTVNVIFSLFYLLFWYFGAVISWFAIVWKANKMLLFLCQSLLTGTILLKSPCIQNHVFWRRHCRKCGWIFTLFNWILTELEMVFNLNQLLNHADVEPIFITFWCGGTRRRYCHVYCWKCLVWALYYDSVFRHKNARRELK